MCLNKKSRISLSFACVLFILSVHSPNLSAKTVHLEIKSCPSECLLTYIKEMSYGNHLEHHTEVVYLYEGQADINLDDSTHYLTLTALNTAHDEKELNLKLSLKEIKDRVCNKDLCISTKTKSNFDNEIPLNFDLTSPQNCTCCSTLPLKATYLIKGHETETRINPIFNKSKNQWYVLKKAFGGILSKLSYGNISLYPDKKPLHFYRYKKPYPLQTTAQAYYLSQSEDISDSQVLCPHILYTIDDLADESGQLVTYYHQDSKEYLLKQSLSYECSNSPLKKFKTGITEETFFSDLSRLSIHSTIRIQKPIQRLVLPLVSYVKDLKLKDIFFATRNNKIKYLKSEIRKDDKSIEIIFCGASKNDLMYEKESSSDGNFDKVDLSNIENLLSRNKNPLFVLFIDNSVHADKNRAQYLKMVEGLRTWSAQPYFNSLLVTGGGGRLDLSGFSFSAHAQVANGLFSTIPQRTNPQLLIKDATHEVYQRFKPQQKPTLVYITQPNRVVSPKIMSSIKHQEIDLKVLYLYSQCENIKEQLKDNPNLFCSSTDRFLNTIKSIYQDTIKQ